MLKIYILFIKADTKLKKKMLVSGKVMALAPLHRFLAPLGS